MGGISVGSKKRTEGRSAGVEASRSRGVDEDALAEDSEGRTTTVSDALCVFTGHVINVRGAINTNTGSRPRERHIE